MRYCLFVFIIGCLQQPAPPLDTGNDTASPVDTSPPPELSISGVRVVDERGEVWSLEAAPWHPTLEILATLPLRAASQFIFLLPQDAPADVDQFHEDLSRSPLRQSNARRSIPLEVETTAFGARARPLERLSPGLYTVGVGAWAVGDASELPEPILLGDATVWTLGVSRTGGAELLGTWPPHGASSIPLDTRRLVTRFSGAVEGVDDMALQGERGRVMVRTSRIACEALGWLGGYCVALEWEGRLRPGVEYRVEFGPRLVDVSGSHVPGEVRFMTGMHVQAQPEFLPVECALDELSTPVGCALVDDGGVSLRVRLDGPGILTLQGLDRVDRELAPRGEATLHVDVPANTELTAHLSVQTLGGHYHTEELRLRTPERLATLTIAEVRANPIGREPTQEYVELLNYGAEPLSLEGLTLADRGDREGDVLPSSPLLAPGARALIVAENFDADDTLDPRPLPGTSLVRIGTSLASGGLSNGGEPLFLRDALGRRLSHVDAAVARPGVCWHRDEGVRSGELREAPCTPGEP